VGVATQTFDPGGKLPRATTENEASPLAGVSAVNDLTLFLLGDRSGV